MPRLFLGNFNFETELRAERQNPPQSLQRLGAELSSAWLAVAQEGDVIWQSPDMDSEWLDRLVECGAPRVRFTINSSELPPALELCPWGWSDEAFRFAQRANLHVSAPAPEAVRQVNSREFGFSLEREWNVGLAAAERFANWHECEAWVAARPPSARWVIKAEFSGAARDRIIGAGQQIPVAAANWLRRRLAQGERLYGEPWVQSTSEFGVQWMIPEQGEVVLEGVTRLLTDDQGRYIGSGFGDPAATSDLIGRSRRAAERLQSAGYFGPAGLDAMIYRDDNGELTMRPLQDINARSTMGRLALGWQRLIPSGVWRHGPIAEHDAAEQAGKVRFRTCPDSLQGAPVRHVTWMEANSS